VKRIQPPPWVSQWLRVTAIALLPAAAVEDSYRDPGVAAQLRADDLLERLSTDEKIAQLMNNAPAIARLRVPAFDYWSEGLHGLARDGYATVFPQAIGLAASWDAPLLRRVGTAVSFEARAKFVALTASALGARYSGLTLWSPNINIFRDPRWGRGQETYGEDPYLTGRLAISFVRGLQGDDPLHPRTIATPKHFAVHSGPEPTRHSFDARISAHDLEDTYLPAFRAAIVEGGARSIMCAYNAIDGTPACANEDLLQHRLREDWAFKGFVVSDCDAVEDMTAFHHYRPDDARSAAAALEAGTDLDCGPAYGALHEALDAGLTSTADIDRALRRLLTARFALGSFDPPAEGEPEFDMSANTSLALRAARESIVLLKNSGATLPLPAHFRRTAAPRIAVIGPSANLLETLEANYHGTARAPITPLSGIQQQFGSRAVISYAQGSVLADGVPIPVPATALRGPDGAPGGLRAEFFTTLDFAAPPTHVRRDAVVDFDWNRIAPAPGISSARYAVRWMGELVPPAPGQYELNIGIDRCFDCSGHDHYRLFIDGQLVADGSAKVRLLDFSDVKPHALKIELLHDSADGGVHLEWRPPARALRDEAVAVAERADVVVACVGLSPRLEGEALQIEVPGFNGGDRTSLELPATQRALLDALVKTHRPLIIVLQTGSAVALDPQVAEAAKAILVAWYPGEAGGRALAETLSGINNPSGRLPMTFYRSVDDLPDFADYSMAGRTYRYFSGTPSYPFGHGLSFTTFRYDSIELTGHEIGAGADIEAIVHVTNTGQHNGDEVVQLYLSFPDFTSAPLRALAGFERIHLAPHESGTVRTVISARAMSLVDADGHRAVMPGRVIVNAGGGQPGYTQTVQTTFTVAGRRSLPR
jgi:beta-glucosidase